MNSMELKVTPWTDETPPTEEELHEYFTEHELRVFDWSGSPQAVLEGHTHGYHKILYVLEGSIKFDFPTRQETVRLNPGDRLDLPAGVRHSAVVGMDGVKCLEAHVY
jgi:quercetin dioxygenase-like cupin family protein